MQLHQVSYGQEVQDEHFEVNHEPDFSRHQITFVVGYSWVPNSIETAGGSETIVIPTLGAEYNYWFTHKLSLKVINELELSRYFVEQSEGNLLEREFKYIIAATAFYEPLKHIGVFAGPGYEYEVHKSFPVVKAGFEIFKNIEHIWAFGLSFSTTINEEYITYSSGLFVAKKF